MVTTTKIPTNFNITLTTQQSIIVRKLDLDTENEVLNLFIRSVRKKITVAKADYGIYSLLLWAAKNQRVEEVLLKILKVYSFTVSKIQ